MADVLNAKSLEGQLLAQLLRLYAAGRTEQRIRVELGLMLDAVTNPEGDAASAPAHLERKHFEAMATAVGLKFEPEPDDAAELRAAAREQYGSDVVSIDKDAAFSVGDDGTWVAAWVLLADEEEDEDEAEG